MQIRIRFAVCLLAFLHTHCVEVAPDSPPEATDTGADIQVDAGSSDIQLPPNDVVAADEEDTNDDDSAEILEALGKTQVLFTINVHDWTMRVAPESGGMPTHTIDTLGLALDLHEQYGVPVDIYLTDAVFQLYVAQAPSLLSRMVQSPLVAISYHRRPSWPLYSGFDVYDSWGLNALTTEAEWYALHMNYETQALDLATGETQPSLPGGFAEISNTFGYPPLAVGHVSGNSMSTLALRNVYEDLGASFGVAQGNNSALGDTLGGLLRRPRDVDILLYENFSGNTPAAQIIEDAITDQPAPAGTRWVNIKFHENNWYTVMTPFDNCFTEAPDYEKYAAPPFDFTACMDPNSKAYAPWKSLSQRERMWTLYEDALIWASSDPDRLHPTNLAWAAIAAPYAVGN
jgi:hypothetical protein